MGEVENGWGSWASPPHSETTTTGNTHDEHWRHFDNSSNSSVNAVSFGFVATAVLISMFLFMAIFERFLRPPPPPRHTPPSPSPSPDVESSQNYLITSLIYGKLPPDHPSHPKVSANAREVSVLMPGEDTPTFIAHPAPIPCPPERISWPPHQHVLVPRHTLNSNSNSNTNSNSSSSSSST